MGEVIDSMPRDEHGAPIPPPPEEKKPGLWTRFCRWVAGEPPTRTPNEDDV